MIKKVLDDFCKAFGLKVNLAKSKVYISPNTRSRASSLSKKLGFSLTRDFGKYLEISMLHKRKSMEQFKDVIENIQKKLSGWKAKNVSMERSATLIQSCSATIPNYNMQTQWVPQSIFDQIDKLNRNFLWGDRDEKKKIHLINQNKVCTLKSNGGLGLRNNIDNNYSLLGKLCWELKGKNNKSLWVEFMRSKCR